MKKRKIIAAIMVVILVCLSLSGCGNKTVQTSAKVNQKDKNNNILASGIIEAEDQYTVSTSVMADILSASFEEGQTVKAGDVLYVLDQKSVRENIVKAKSAIESAQLAYNLNEDNVNKLSVTSDCSGTVTNIYADAGNMVTAGFKVADVVDDSQMKLTIPFLSDTISGIFAGQSAEVSIVGTFYTLTGTVSHVSSGSLTTANGSKVNMVEITVNNPGTLKKGDKATATIGSIACNDAGQFDYASSGAITTEVAGKVADKKIKVGDKVNAGSVAIVLTNDALLNQRQQYALNIKDANFALKTLNDKLPDYTITSKLNGTIIKKNVNKNDTISATNMGNLAVIADLSKIKLEVKVDEMDISHIKVGDAVSITTDADASKKYKGTVDYIGKSGTNTNGVALYDVKIVISDFQDLLPGMNVTAKFNLDKKEGK